MKLTCLTFCRKCQAFSGFEGQWSGLHRGAEELEGTILLVPSRNSIRAEVKRDLKRKSFNSNPGLGMRSGFFSGVSGAWAQSCLGPSIRNPLWQNSTTCWAPKSYSKALHSHQRSYRARWPKPCLRGRGERDGWLLHFPSARGLGGLRLKVFRLSASQNLLVYRGLRSCSHASPCEPVRVAGRKPAPDGSTSAASNGVET